MCISVTATTVARWNVRSSTNLPGPAWVGQTVLPSTWRWRSCRRRCAYRKQRPAPGDKIAGATCLWDQQRARQDRLAVSHERATALVSPGRRTARQAEPPAPLFPSETASHGRAVELLPAQIDIRDAPRVVDVVE